MKRPVLSALAVFSILALSTLVNAQDISPLIQKETVSVTHLKLDKLDPDTLSSQVEKVGSAAVDYFVKDADTASETKQVLPFAGIFINQYFENYVAPLKNAGVTDLYLVVDQSDDPDETTYPFLVFPTESLSQSQLDDARSAMKSLNSQLDSKLKYRFTRFGYSITIITLTDVDEDEIKAYVKKRFGKANTDSRSEFADGFALANPNAIITTVGVPASASVAKNNTNKISEAIETLESMADVPEEVVNKIEESFKKISDLSAQCDSLVKYNVFEVNLDDLEIVSRIVANSATDAQKYVKVVGEDLQAEADALIDFAFEQEGVAEALTVVASASGDDDLSGTVKDVLALFFSAKANDNVVEWKINEAFWSDNSDVIHKLADDVISMVSAFNSDEDIDDDFDDEDDVLDDFDEEE